jgi:hypothetical protein
MDKLDEWDWPAHADALPTDALGMALVERRADIEVLGYITDAEADYSFHDFAFIRLDGQWYVLETSGCSCPSPAEEWQISVGPVAVDGLRAAVDAMRSDWGPTARQWGEFVAMCDAAEAES